MANLTAPEYPIATERLLLRPCVDDERDLDALLAIQSRPDVTRYLYYEPRTREQVRDGLIQRSALPWFEREGDALRLAVVLPASNALIGELTLGWNSQEHQQGELGYIIHPDFAGNGYATEAARELLPLGFDWLGLHRIIGRCDGRNQASARVMERLGMRREAHFIQNECVKGEWTDELVYAILADEWRANAG